MVAHTGGVCASTTPSTTQLPSHSPLMRKAVTKNVLHSQHPTHGVCVGVGVFVGDGVPQKRVSVGLGDGVGVIVGVCVGVGLGGGVGVCVGVGVSVGVGVFVRHTPFPLSTDPIGPSMQLDPIAHRQEPSVQFSPSGRTGHVFVNPAQTQQESPAQKSLAWAVQRNVPFCGTPHWNVAAQLTPDHRIRHAASPNRVALVGIACPHNSLCTVLGRVSGPPPAPGWGQHMHRYTQPLSHNIQARALALASAY